MKALLMTLGFDERFCCRAILRHGIAEGDKIVLLTAGLVDRVKKAYEWIKTFVERSYDVEVKLIEVDVKDFIRGVKDVITVLEELGDYDLIVNLSGGMRALAIIVLIALLIKPIRNLKVEIELEDFSGVVEIPQTLFRLSKLELSEEKKDILKMIVNGYRDVKSLAKATNRDESTVRRHISSLESLGLIEIERKKPLIVKATDLAGLFVR